MKKKMTAANGLPAHVQKDGRVIGKPDNSIRPENGGHIMSTKIKDVMDKLPPIAYGVNPGNERQVTMLKRGVMGFWEMCVCATPEMAAAKVKFLNEHIHITEAQAEAMLNGSVFGFHTPAADPDNCRTEKKS